MKSIRHLLITCTALACVTLSVKAIRATSLIFNKSAVSTTTDNSALSSSISDVTIEPIVNETSTKVTLTGIPQIDYKWDPNLPRELNGYNLSEYPFFNAVPPPEEIDFKCDGLHDGFYASVKHKCQLYHHCLYGVRYDFLCANYTAFDQKTFICHFVSEVDCKNSPKYFHRNDALYQAVTSTTTTTTTTATPPTTPPASGLSASDQERSRPIRPFRRPPVRRRRPVDYYYDDDYDDYYYDQRITRRRRPRPRQPDYEEEYDDYRGNRNEDRHEKRLNNRNRAPNESHEDEFDRRKSRRPVHYNRPNNSRYDDDQENRRPSVDRRRPYEDMRLSDERRTTSNDQRHRNDNHYTYNNGKRFSSDQPQSHEDDENGNRYRPSNHRHRVNNDHQLNSDDEIDHSNRRHLNNDNEKNEYSVEQKPSASKQSAKPSTIGGSSSLSLLFDRPRTLPVARPVPLHEKKKYVSPLLTTTTVSSKEEEYYDEYEDAPSHDASSKKIAEKGTESQSSIPSLSRNRSRDSSSSKEDDGPHLPSIRNMPTSNSKHSLYENDARSKLSKNERLTSRSSSNNKFGLENVEFKEQQEQLGSFRQKEHIKPEVYNSEFITDKPTRANNHETRKIEPEVRPIIRVVKRPFLPSRGGSPYLPRGLQPVGTPRKLHDSPMPKAFTATTTDSSAIIMDSTISGVRLLEHAAPILRESISNSDYPLVQSGPRTTQKPKIEIQPDLDVIYENEYDVTLNDALNPTLRPLASNQGDLPAYSYVGKYVRDTPSSNESFLNTDSSVSSTTVKKSATIPSSKSRISLETQPRHQITRDSSQLYYDEYDY